MAGEIIFNQAQYLRGLGINWETDTIEQALLLKGAWTPNADDDYVQTALTAGATDVGDRVALVNPAVILDDANNRARWDQDDYSHTGVANAQAFDSYIVYLLVTNDGDSPLLGYFPLGSLTGDGNPISLAMNALGLFAWPV